MRPAPVKRFYKTVDVRRGGRPPCADPRRRGARTPGRNPLAAKSRAVMDAVAEEWARQGETLDPSDMPVTRLSIPRSTAWRRRWTRRGRRSSATPAPTSCATAPRSRRRSPSGSAKPSIPCSPGRPRCSARASRSRRASCTSRSRRRRSPPSTPRSTRIDDPLALAALSVVTTPHRLGVLALAVARGRLDGGGGVANRPCRRGFPDRALGRGRGGDGAARIALARDGGCGGGSGRHAGCLTPSGRGAFALREARRRHLSDTILRDLC